MTAFDPRVAARIAESGIPMSADSAPPSPERAAREGLAAYEKHPEIGFDCCSAHAAADTVSALLAENERLRGELADRMEDIAFTDRNTLPELRRTIQRHVDGKKRWRDRAEKAEPERDALQERLHQVALAKVWTNEDGKKFVFADDIAQAAPAAASTVIEWGVRLADGGFTAQSRDRKQALEALPGLRAYEQNAVLVTRTVHFGAWTETAP